MNGDFACGGLMHSACQKQEGETGDLDFLCEAAFSACARLRNKVDRFRLAVKEYGFRRLVRDSLQHWFNPLHVYCRLRDMHVEDPIASRISGLYGRYLYNCVFTG